MQKEWISVAERICGRTKMGKRPNREEWWWSEEVKEAIARKKDALKEMRKNDTEENKARYKNMKNRAKKVVARAMRGDAEKTLSELRIRIRCLR